MQSTAREWFRDCSDLQQLCDAAVKGALTESGKVFSEHIQWLVKKHGLDTYLSEPQLAWLCYLATGTYPTSDQLAQLKRMR